MLLPKIKKIPRNTNGRLAIPALAGLLVLLSLTLLLLLVCTAHYDSLYKSTRMVWLLDGEKV